MGANRTRVDRKIRQPIDASVWHRLTDGLADRPEPFNEEAVLAVEYFDDPERGWRRLWREHGRDIVRLWAEHRPGRRPSLWWKFDSPEPRRRLGGVGTPSHECLAYAPAFERGLPKFWLSADLVRYYTERDGRPWTKGVPIDPLNPPLFEGEGAYLRRLDLLLPGELDRTPEEVFEPEAASPESDPATDYALAVARGGPEAA